MGDPQQTPIVVTAVSTERPSGTTVTAETPDHLPNNTVVYISPLIAILVRALKTYLDTLLGVLGAQGTGLMPQLSGRDFAHSLVIAAGIAVMPAAISILRNAASLLGNLEQKYPTLQA